MKFLNPYSISGRIMIVLLVGLSVSHIASTAFLSHDRLGSSTDSGFRLSAERIAALAKMFERQAKDQRAALAADLSSPSLQIVPADVPDIPPGHRDDESRKAVLDAFRTVFGDAPRDGPHVVRASAPETDASSGWKALHGFPRRQIMLISFRLADGSWMNFHLTVSETDGLWSPRTIGSLAIMLLGILAFGLWATRWVGRPAATFAAAADRLGRDVNAPPLTEDGPPEMRQAVAAFNEMQARLRRFVEDRTRMLAAISHDLRSPLTRLRLRTEMLADESLSGRMLDDIDAMETMVASALDFARGESADEESQTIDLAAALGTICDDASDMGLPARYAWRCRVLCSCRPKALKRALTNLVENAARYGHRARVRAEDDRHGIVVVIDDDGPGIPEEDMENVFKPFFRLEESRNRKSGGAGLGMTVARAVVRAHGGEIHLANRPEGGLRVTVILPQSHARATGAP